jgi:hypothetical protein
MNQTTIPSGLLSHILLAQAVRQKQVAAGHRGRSPLNEKKNILLVKLEKFPASAIRNPVSIGFYTL